MTLKFNTPKVGDPVSLTYLKSLESAIGSHNTSYGPNGRVDRNVQSSDLQFVEAMENFEVSTNEWGVEVCTGLVTPLLYYPIQTKNLYGLPPVEELGNRAFLAVSVRGRKKEGERFYVAYNQQSGCYEALADEAPVLVFFSLVPEHEVADIEEDIAEWYAKIGNPDARLACGREGDTDYLASVLAITSGLNSEILPELPYVYVTDLIGFIPHPECGGSGVALKIESSCTTYAVISFVEQECPESESSEEASSETPPSEEASSETPPSEEQPSEGGGGSSSGGGGGSGDSSGGGSGGDGSGGGGGSSSGGSGGSGGSGSGGSGGDGSGGGGGGSSSGGSGGSGGDGSGGDGSGGGSFSGTSGSSGGSGSGGSGGGSGGSGGDGPSGGGGGGSGKDTAIVKASWTTGGYTALYALETPDVRFEDILVCELNQVDSTATIDPKFIEVCEPGGIEVCGHSSNLPVLIGASTDANKIKILFAEQKPDQSLRIVFRVTAIRRGFAGVRFPDKTEADYENNQFRLNIGKGRSTLGTDGGRTDAGPSVHGKDAGVGNE